MGRDGAGGKHGKGPKTSEEVGERKWGPMDPGGAEVGLLGAPRRAVCSPAFLKDLCRVSRGGARSAVGRLLTRGRSGAEQGGVCIKCRS